MDATVYGRFELMLQKEPVLGTIHFIKRKVNACQTNC